MEIQVEKIFNSNDFESNGIIQKRREAVGHHPETFHQLEQKQVQSRLPQHSHHFHYISATKVNLR